MSGQRKNQWDTPMDSFGSKSRAGTPSAHDLVDGMKIQKKGGPGSFRGERSKGSNKPLWILVGVATTLLIASGALVIVFLLKLKTGTVSSAGGTDQIGAGGSTGSTGAQGGSGTSAPVPTATAAYNGRCGSAFGFATCPTDANSLTQGYVPCCGSDGYCGSSYYSCGTGCQSGCDAFTPATSLSNSGTWTLKGKSGVPAMHVIMVPNTGHIIMLGKQELFTELNLTSTRYAYSSEWNPDTLDLLALDLKTNPFCSGIGNLPDGRIISVGGSLNYNDPMVASGYNGIRILTRPCDGAAVPCDWQETDNLKLQSDRWYPTIVNLPDGRMFVIGGIAQFDQGLAVDKQTNNPTYEYYPATPAGNFQLDLLAAPNVFPFQMYPHVHVLRSGRLFIMAGLSSIILDPLTNAVVKNLPDLPGIYPRTYPSVGAGTMLPISYADNYTVHFMVCGGGHPDLWIEQKGTDSCGIITPEAANPTWDTSETAPQARVMVHPTILADGSIIFVNGALQGHQGWEAGKSPVLAPDIFIPNAPKGKRWYTMTASTIPRMYHSISIMMPDATVLITGSNPHLDPVVNGSSPYPTEYRNEILTPPYLSTTKTRPTFTTDPPATVTPGQQFTVTGTWNSKKPMQASFYFPGGVTHSLHMSTRLVFAPTVVQSANTLQITTPPDNNVVPPGFYLLYIVNDGVPSIGKWVQITLA
ncbi:hypothetical protein M427DRAFT_120307 [Gonapodya prolifera JEL478]|uniref:Chitin-binding type-1 domain-containing protein n=1 Tax=Gonapodya prolifera (strain JEL478) TaxID=1344416 RepID=A0A139ATU3_GONPJ|nr:hypothetical protein M427DRAFT_120307 [Gonapodya prolifera JEL478]|eukprot:KXS19925.1 hypothetical protein M427DRAFT_120307 [Gonapodya prolifera JEL478]